MSDNIWDRPWITTYLDNSRESRRPNPGAFAYRYVDYHGTDFYTDETGEPQAGNRYVEIKLETFTVISYTPKGFWIKAPTGKKFINHSWGKKHAHLNLAEARHAFKIRKGRQQSILKEQLDRISQVMEAIEDDKWSGRCPKPAFKLVRKLA